MNREFPKADMIYLDNAATTIIDPRVAEVVRESMSRDFANSGSVYRIGLDVRNRIEKAREELADALHVPSNYRMVFTSGASESNNLFIKGACFPGKKVACLGMEHPSIADTLEYLEKNGSQRIVCAQKAGRFEPASMQQVNEQRPRLLCLSHVNNELGCVNDLSMIVPALSNSPTRLFVDGVQAVGKLAIGPGLWKGVAGYSISAHKIHGPKGIGLLIYDSKIELTPQIHGGRQQYGVRSGTLAPFLILGMVEAVKLAVQSVDETQAHLRRLRNHLIAGLRDLSNRSQNLKIRFNSLVEDDPGLQSPAIVNFSFSPVEGEVILHHLEEKDIFVSMGSACSAHSKQPSKILTGIGLSVEEARCSLRVSFSRQNTLEEVDIFLKEFSRAYEFLYPTFCSAVAQ